MKTLRILTPFIFALAAIAMAPGNVSAQSEAVVITVDFQRVTSESAVGQDVQKQIQSVQLELQTKVAEMDENLSTEKAAIEQQRPLLDEPMFQEKATAFNLKAQADRKALNDKAEQIQREVQQANLAIERELKPIVRKIMEEKGATIVFDKSRIYEQASGMDVTTEVIDQLNSVLPTYQIDVPDFNS